MAINKTKRSTALNQITDISKINSEVNSYLGSVTLKVLKFS